MNLVISGMALSLQWAPSLQHAEYLLTGQYQGQPALVEHPGEVILKALSGIPARDSANLILRQLGQRANLGHYLSLIDDQFRSLRVIPSRSDTLIDLILQAGSLIRGKNDHVLISETTPAGTAAILVSRPDSAVPVLLQLETLEQALGSKKELNYLGAPFSWDDRSLLQLDRVVDGWNLPGPIPLGNFNAPQAGTKALPVLIQTALAVLNQVIPAGKESEIILPEGKPENILPQPEFKPWFSRSRESKRTALFGQGRANAQTWEFIGLKETTRASSSPQIRRLPETDPHLFLVKGNDLGDFTAELDSLEILLTKSGSLETIALNCYAKYRENQDQLTCCLLGSSREGLLKEIQGARAGLETAFRDGQPWSSPAGSYFTPLPLKGEIAFVYPGGFNSYPGMARELFYSFPGLQDAARDLIPDLSHSLAEELIYPERNDARDNSPENQQQNLYRYPNQLIESGISLAVLHTLLLDQVLGLRPEAALGYSLGEVSMLWANQVWGDASTSSQDWSQSRLLQDMLVGDMKIVREYWKERTLPEDFWITYILKEETHLVQTACQKDPLVFMTIANTPGEVVIAGERNACQSVIESLGCRALPVPFSPAIHTPAIEASVPDFRKLYSNPTRDRPETRFYSAADYQQLTLNRDSLAAAMAKMTCSPLDFPRLIEQVYRDGARIFIEVGPQKTCSRWIEKILEGKPHAAIPINKKYQRDFPGVIKVISLLVSEDIDLNLEPFFKPAGAAFLASITTATENPPPLMVSVPQQSGLAAAPSESPGQEPKFPAFFDHLERISAGAARSHRTYLSHQRTLTKNLVRVLNLQQEVAVGGDLEPVQDQPLYSRQQIQEFTRGDPANCFGDLFAGFQGRRIPRLPNGPLQFIDRVVQVPPTLGQVIPGGSLVSEYELPDDPWFKPDRSTTIPPLALMELALQPCGFLSAYLGSILGRESQDLYFRNLDGTGTVLEWPEKPTGVLTNRVELRSSSSLDQVIIQEYGFDLLWDDQPFFTGRSSFGYFTKPLLRDQAGLDGGSYSPPWQEDHPRLGAWQEVKTPNPDPQAGEIPQLPQINQIWIAPDGGHHNQGYLYLEQPIPADAWYFQAHFFQDPVMPGSLGVESMVQALMAAAPYLGVSGDHDWRMKPNQNLSWKYRGQITPGVDRIAFDLHLKELHKKGEKWEITAEGQLWKGSLRIYEIKNICLESQSVSRSKKL